MNEKITALDQLAGGILQDNITELYYGIVLRDNITELCDRIMLRDNITA